MAGDVLSTRALNRTLLARQMLLQRRSMSVEAALEWLVGMQAQEPQHPYYGLWTRLADFDPAELSGLLVDRKAVRTAVMRTTIHLLTSRDALRLRLLLAPVLERTLRSTPFGKGTVGLDLDAVLQAGIEIVEEKPRTLAELGKLLQVQWPDREPINLARTVHYLAPLLQIPPRGTWGASHQATWTTIERWLGEPLQATYPLEEVVLRYLAAFGPASTSDVRTWSGLSGLRDIMENLRPRLRVFRDEKGRELFDLPDAPRADADEPAPVRFLPGYDNVFLSHDDRSRIIDDDLRKGWVTPNGVGLNPFTVDGFISGTWGLSKEKKSARLVIAPVVELSPNDRVELEEEGTAFLAFATPGAESRTVEFVSRD